MRRARNARHFVAAALAIVVALAIGLALASGPPAPRLGAPAPGRPGADTLARAGLRRALLAADSMLAMGRPGEARARADSLLRASRTHGDRWSEARALLVGGLARSRTGDVPGALAAIREATAIVRADRDSILLVRALRNLAFALRFSASGNASDVVRELHAIGETRDDASALGFAWFFEASDSLTAGRFTAARLRYERAAHFLHRSGDTDYALDATIGLGRALWGLGDLEGSRACNQRVAEQARRLGRAWVEAHAVNNLGTYELMVGDPGLAAGYFRRAGELHEAGANGAGAIIALVNQAIATQAIGALDDAEALLRQAESQCRARSDWNELSRVQSQLGNVASQRGRLHEARERFREALVRADSLSVFARVTTALAAVEFLRDVDSLDAARRVFDAHVVLLRERVWPLIVTRMDRVEGQLELRAGHPARALELLQRAEAGATRLGQRLERLQALATMVRAQRALGESVAALETARRAVEAWESERRVPIDPEWRAARGSTVREIATQLAALLIEGAGGAPGSERVGQAFDALQRLKARTLQERVANPARSEPVDVASAGVVSLSRFQRETLRERELFLDTFLGPDSSLVFAVTRDTCFAFWIPGQKALAARIRLYRSAIAHAPGRGARNPNDAALAASGALGRLLVPPAVATRLARCDRLITAPDGELNGVAIAALSSAAGLLIERAEVVVSPSASLLARARRTRPPGAIVPARGPLLAIAGRLGSEGRPLPGAAREVEQLGRNYRDVEVVLAGRDAPLAHDSTLRSYRVLHVAAHTRVDDQHPWRSGIALGGLSAGASAGWRASDIASRRLNASLAVLSGCESAGGRALTGEGVQGLSTAFLSAGVPAVVATLWPVSDRASARLMESFYRSLGRGESASAALRRAQLELARDTATRAPFYWAGFVLVGDPDVRVDLERRADTRAIAIAVAAGALLIAAGLWQRRRVLRIAQASRM